MDNDFPKAVYDEVPDIYVPRKCCHECVFFPGSPLDKQEHQQLITDVLSAGRIFECIHVTVARRYGASFPEDVCCYGLFYQYYAQIPVLREALQEEKICYFDIEGLPGLKESGFSLYITPNGRKWE